MHVVVCTFILMAKKLDTLDNQPFIPKGFIVARDKFRLPIEPLPRTVKNEEGPSLTINDNTEMVSICSEKVEFVFSKTEKNVKSYKLDGFEYISKGFGFQPNFWRGPTDNDYGNGAPNREQFWKKMSHEFKIDQCQATIENNVANLTVIYVLDDKFNRLELSMLKLITEAHKNVIIEKMIAYHELDFVSEFQLNYTTLITSEEDLKKTIVIDAVEPKLTSIKLLLKTFISLT